MKKGSLFFQVRRPGVGVAVPAAKCADVDDRVIKECGKGKDWPFGARKRVCVVVDARAECTSKSEGDELRRAVTVREEAPSLPSLSLP